MKHVKWVLLLILVVWGVSKIDYQNGKGEGCAFCKPHILNEQSLYIGPLASVLVTHKPVVPGHFLVIPNRHVATFEDLTSDELAEMGELIKKIYHTQPGEYLLLQKNGASAGQTVPHVHIHYLPRRPGMGHVHFCARLLLQSQLKPLSEKELEKVVEEGRALLLSSDSAR
ncbi:MAG: HIT family protein [Verrucomicrobiota bacterium]|nr:HIT family protein [Verrucomicrobiota bacterium]